MRPRVKKILIFIAIIIAIAVLAYIDTSTLLLLILCIPICILIGLFWSIIALVRYYRKLKYEQKPFLNKITISVGVSILSTVLLFAGYVFILSQGPTAIVLDAETGKPIEDAVALAQWSKPVALGLGLGASQALEKATESFSDKDGKIYIEGYWRFFLDARLMVYKPGYVLWDNKVICPFGKRTDFDSKHRTVKLLKFETESTRWLKEGYDVGRGRPRGMHDSFFSSCYAYSTEIGMKYGDQIKIQKIFDEYEIPFRKKETAGR
jgi:hypothetical protein